MIVYDDLEPSEKIKIYDKGISAHRRPGGDPARCGSATAPATCGRPSSTAREALRVEAEHFVDCIDDGETPITDGEAGLRVVRILEAATAVDAAQRRRRCICVQRSSGIVIPFLDLKAQYRAIKPEVDRRRSARARQRRSSCSAREVAAFEDEFARLLPADARVGVNTGTSALHLALLAAGVGPGDEVITAPFTFVATASAIAYAGAKPVFVDIDPRPARIDPSRIEAAITPRTKAIMPVHLYGQSRRHGPDPGDRRRHGLRRHRGRGAGARRRATRAAAPAASATSPASASIRARTSAPTARAAWSSTNDAGAGARTMRMLRDWGAGRGNTTTPSRATTTAWTASRARSSA